VQPRQERPPLVPGVALGVQADQHFLDQILRLMHAQPELGEAIPDQPTQQRCNLLEQALIGCAIASTLGAHGFGPVMFARLHIFLLVGTAGNVTDAPDCFARARGDH
jgi:hypothetical protein